MPRVSIIIPTTCESFKQVPLERAIASVSTQQGVDVEVIVVVNGNKVDSGLFERLGHNRRISVHHLQEGHVSKARLAGLHVATGEYFGFLDDDDELLPQALMIRMSAMACDERIDVLVTNGYIYNGDDVLHVPLEFTLRIVESAELSLLQHNWFASPASLFRRASVDPAMLDLRHIYFEWTFLFFRLLSNAKKIEYIDAVTYRKHEDNPYSVSKSAEYRLAQPAFLLDLMRMPLSDEVRTMIRQKFVVALNSSAILMLESGKPLAAAALHLQCLKSGGWRYIPFTRRLLTGMLGGAGVSRR